MPARASAHRGGRFTFSLPPARFVRAIRASADAAAGGRPRSADGRYRSCGRHQRLRDDDSRDVLPNAVTRLAVRRRGPRELRGGDAEWFRLIRSRWINSLVLLEIRRCDERNWGQERRAAMAYFTYAHAWAFRMACSVTRRREYGTGFLRQNGAAHDGSADARGDVGTSVHTSNRATDGDDALPSSSSNCTSRRPRQHQTAALP